MATHPTRVQLYRRGPIWYLSYWQDGVRVKESTGLVRKGDAEVLQRDLEKKLVEGRLAGLSVSKIPVSRCYRQYLVHGIASYKRDKTQDTDRSVLKIFFRWAGVRTIDQLTTAKVMDYFAYRVKVDKLQASSLRRNREALHAFFNYVKRRGYIATNPVTDVKPPRLPEKDIRFLSLRQIDGCLQAFRGNLLEPVVACAIFAGLRREEICWLAWEDVDLTEGKALLRIRYKTEQAPEGDVEGEAKTWMPKTKRNRFVPIHSRLLPYLVELRIQQGTTPWVFQSPEGCRWDPDNLGHRLAKERKPMDLKWTMLDFRHTYGSQLAMKGVSIYKIAKLMGNSARVAEKHYAALQTQELHKDIEFGVESQDSSVKGQPGKRKGRST